MIRVKQFHYFTALAKHLNYKSAAAALGVSQSVLSQQISELEAQLGTDLFYRGKRSLTLSPAGETLFTKLPDLFSLMYDTVNLMQNEKRTSRTKEILRIGYERPYDYIAISQIIKEYQNLNSEIHVTAHQYNILEMSDLLLSGDLDLVFMTLPSAVLPPTYYVQVLRADHICLLVRKEIIQQSPTQNITKLLKNLPLYCFQKNTGGTNVVLPICNSIGLVPELRFCDSFDEIMLNVSSGLGYTIVPSSSTIGVVDFEKILSVDLSAYPGSNICLAVATPKDGISYAVQQFLNNLPIAETNCVMCHHLNIACSGYPLLPSLLD